MIIYTNTDWIFLIINTRVIVRSFTPAFFFTGMRLRHIKFLESPTFRVKLDAEVSVAGIFGHLVTAVIENKIRIIIHYAWCLFQDWMLMIAFTYASVVIVIVHYYMFQNKQSHRHSLHSMTSVVVLFVH